MLNDALAAEMPFLQSQAESVMTLTVLAEVQTTAGAPNLDTMDDGPDWEPRGSSRAKVQPPGRQPQGRTVTVGGTERTLIEGGLHLPLHAYLDDNGRLLIRAGWRFTVTAVGAEDDPALLDQTYVVVEVLKKSRATARRLDVVEV